MNNEIHRIKYKNKKIILDIPSTNTFLINNLDETILELLSDFSENKIIEKLSSDYKIEDIKRGIEQIKMNTTINSKRNRNYNLESPTYTLILHPSRKCNLDCKYCFGNGEYISNVEISSETAKEAINYMVDDLAKDSKKYIVDVSGSGEPLLRFDFIKEIYHYCREVSKRIDKEILVMFATNGTLLDEEKIEWLDKPDILYGISIDGDKDLNDSLRVYKNGKGTYDRIIKNAKKTDNKKRLGLAVTLTGKHKKIKSIFKDLFDLQVANAISMKPVRGKIGTEYAINAENLEEIKKGYEELSSFLLEKSLKGEKDYIYTIIRGADYFGKYIKRVIRHTRIVRRCDAGLSRVSVNHKGELFMCQVKIDDLEFKIGDIYKGLNKEKYHKMKGIVVDDIDQCSKCWARYICGGECFAVGKDINDSFTEPDNIMCDLKKHMIKLSIYLVNMIKEKKIELFNELLTFCIRQDVYNGSDSGAYTLNKLGKYHGIETSIDEIRDIAEINETGIKPINLLKAGKKIGLPMKAARANKEHLKKDIIFPAIANFNGGYGSVTNYYVLLKGLENNKVKIVDAMKGEVEYKIEDFCELWSGLIFVLGGKGSEI